MRTIRLYCDQALPIGQSIELAGSPARHLLRVLRRRVDDEVVLFNGDGGQCRGRIVAIDGREHCRIELLERTEPAVESTRQMTLVQALIRSEPMDWCIQKATELGVWAIQPVVSDYSEVRLDPPRRTRRLEHWRKVAIAAAEQCGRVRLPCIDSPIEINRLPTARCLDVFFHPSADGSIDRLDWRPDQALRLLIGPEGGWSDTEIQGFIRRGMTALRLGPLILRAETAGPAAIAALHACFGDWRK